MRVGVLLVLVLIAAGCQKPVATSPEATYRAFVTALQRSDARRAFDMLTPATREKVQLRSKAISEASQGLVRDEPQLLLFQSSRPGELGEISQVRADEATAVLKVATADGEREVKLVKDSGRWLIDLSEQLEASGTP